MGYYQDVYSSPELHGLRIVETHEAPDLSYEFDMVVLWEDIKTRKRYWARDSGCSCPSPFENVRSVSELNDWSLTKREYEQEVKGVLGRP